MTKTQCEKCLDKGHSKGLICLCISEEKLLSAIDYALDDLKFSNKWETYFHLACARKCLPNYPVMAVMECDHYKMKDLSKMIREYFGVKQIY